MTSQQTTQSHCFLDAIGLPQFASKLPLGIGQQKAHRRRIAQGIAARRIVEHHASRDVAKDGSTAFYRRQDLFGSNNSYQNCIFLDPHGTVAVASDSMGRLDVVRLPDFDDKNESRPMGTLLAGKMSIRQGDDRAGSFHLKSIDRGNSFCVGMPNGEVGIFATERTADLGRRYGLLENAARIYQEPQDSNFIKSSWSISLARQNHIRHSSQGHVSFFPFRPLDNLNLYSTSPEEDWEAGARKRVCSYDNKYRWAFLETASSAILAAYIADVELQGVALHVTDSRLRQVHRKSAFHIDIMPSCRSAPAGQETVSSVCWMSDNILLTSHVHRLGQGNTLKLWDMRKSGAFAGHPVGSYSFCSTRDTATTCQEVGDNVQSARVLRVTPSVDGTGSVLVTFQQHKDSATNYEYHLLEVGTWKLQQRMESSFTAASGQDYGVPSYTAAPLVDAVTPHLECLATFESPSIIFYNLSSVKDMQRTSIPKATGASCGTKRRSVGDEQLNNKSTHGKLTPKLIDGDSLPTKLSCMAYNDSGTAMIGGSFDGDFFVWRGG